MTDQKTIDPVLLGGAVELTKAWIQTRGMTLMIIDVPDVFKTFYDALSGISPEVVEPTKQEPAVPIKKSITDDYLICLDDGKKFKSMKRHLVKLGMTPTQYRQKWGLPADYPMVAPAYSAYRSELAQQNGLGHSR